MKGNVAAHASSKHRKHFHISPSRERRSHSLIEYSARIISPRAPNELPAAANCAISLNLGGTARLSRGARSEAYARLTSYKPGEENREEEKKARTNTMDLERERERGGEEKGKRKEGEKEAERKGGREERGREGETRTAN